VEQYQIGKMYYGAPGTRRTPWQFPQVAASLREQITLVTEAIDKLSIPRIESNLGGIEASGFAINQVLAEARIRYDPLGQSIERMLDEVTRFLWHLVRTKVREKVWIYTSGKQGGWKGLGPDDLKAGRHTDAFVQLMTLQAARARHFYRAAWAAFPVADARSLVAAEIMGRIYHALLEAIEARGFRVLDQRVALSRRRKIAIALRCWAAARLGAGSSPGRSG